MDILHSNAYQDNLRVNALTRQQVLDLFTINSNLLTYMEKYKIVNPIKRGNDKSSVAFFDGNDLIRIYIFLQLKGKLPRKEIMNIFNHYKDLYTDKDIDSLILIIDHKTYIVNEKYLGIRTHSLTENMLRDPGIIHFLIVLPSLKNIFQGFIDLSIESRYTKPAEIKHILNIS